MVFASVCSRSRRWIGRTWRGTFRREVQSLHGGSTTAAASTLRAPGWLHLGAVPAGSASPPLPETDQTRTSTCRSIMVREAQHADETTVDRLHDRHRTSRKIESQARRQRLNASRGAHTSNTPTTPACALIPARNSESKIHQPAPRLRAPGLLAVSVETPPWMARKFADAGLRAALLKICLESRGTKRRPDAIAASALW